MTQRSYLLHIPASYRQHQPLPLVIALHGAGQSAADFARFTGWSELAEQKHFAVAYPQAAVPEQAADTMPRWVFTADDATDTDFILAMSAAIANNITINTSRIYLTGVSNGAQMVARLGCVAPAMFAAIAPVAGNYPPDRDCDNTPLPAFIMHGTADKTLPYDGRLVQFSPLFWAAHRAKQNGCNTMPLHSKPNATTRRQSWEQCDDHAGVIFDTLVGQSHGWPPNATATLWQFMQNYER